MHMTLPSLYRLCCYSSRQLHSHGQQRSGTHPLVLQIYLKFAAYWGFWLGKRVQSHSLEDLLFSKYLICPWISPFQPIKNFLTLKKPYSTQWLSPNSTLFSTMEFLCLCWGWSPSVLSSFKTGPRTLETQPRKTPLFQLSTRACPCLEAVSSKQPKCLERKEHREEMNYWGK